MKTFQLLCLVLTINTLSAQVYHPFVQYGAYRDEFSSPGELAICYYTYGTRYWFSGDTTLGGQTYHKLWWSPILGDVGTPFCPPYQVDTSDRLLFGLMREDLQTRRVFRYYPEAGAEFLLYDFGAQPGDSIDVDYPPVRVYIDTIVTEIWNDGSERQRWLVQSPVGGAGSWLESLGNTNALWTPAAGLCICPYALCYQQEGENLYGNVCATAVSAGEPNAARQPAVRILPNPASCEVRVAGNPFDRLTLHDFSGKTVLEKTWSTPVSSAGLTVGHLQPGLFQVNLWLRGQAVGGGKLYKQ